MKFHLLYYIYFVFCFIACSEKDTAYKGKNIATAKDSLILFSYKKLAKDTFEYHHYTGMDKYIESALYRDGAKYNGYYREIDKEHGISLYNFSQQKPDSGGKPFAKHDRDFLKIGAKQYIFEELEFGSNFIKEWPRFFSLINAYNFLFNKRLFFVSFFESTTNRSKPNFLICLFEISDKNKPILLLFDYQASATIDCLGDFNNDGYLDFAHRTQLGKKLTCKTLKNDKFETIEGYYLTIIDSPRLPKIDLKNSKWFFDLGKK